MAEVGDAMDIIADVIGALMMTYSLSFLFSIVCYVLESLGIYTIAKRRGIHNPWLAWIPVANCWITGSISDQYRFVARDKVTNRRKILLFLSIGASVLSVVLVANMIQFYLKMFFNGMFGAFDQMTDEMVMQLLGPQVASIFSMGMLTMVLGVVMAVYTYIVLYDIYTSCDPSNGTLYLVLSILLNVTRPFLIFACRNKDDGMPRRQAEPETYVNPAPTYREPWENSQE